jgi:hypothetical protein
MKVRDGVNLFLDFNYSAAISFDYDDVMEDNPSCKEYIHSIRLINKIPLRVSVNLHDTNIIMPNRITFSRNKIFDYGINIGIIWYNSSDDKCGIDMTHEAQKWLEDNDTGFLDLDEHKMLMLKTYLEMI